MQKYGWLLFVAGAILTWGAYVVTIDHGRTRLAEGMPRTHMSVAAMRAFLFIGLAYFVMAVIVVRVLLDYVSRRGFSLFGWWRLFVGGVGLAALFIWG